MLRHIARVSARARDAAAQAEALRLAAGLIQFLVLARLMTVSEYGQLAILYFAAALAAPLVNSRGTMVNVRRAAHGTNERPLLRAVLLSTMCGAGAAAVLTGVFGATGVLPGGVIASAGILVSELCAGTALQGIASIRQGRLDLAGYRNWIAVAAGGRVVAVVAFAASGSHSLAAWATLVAAVLSVVAVAGLAIAFCHARCTDDGDPVGSSPPWETSIFALNALTLRVSDDADKALLAAFESYSAVGIYTVAYRIASYILFPSRAVMGRFMPAIFKEGCKPAPDWPAVVREARRELVSMLGLAAPVLVAASLAAPLVLGRRYANAEPMAVALIPLLALRGFHWIYGDVLVAVGRVRSRLVGQVASLVVPMVAYVALIPSLGAWGAVLGTGVGEAIAIAFMREIALRETGARGTARPPAAVRNEAAQVRVSA
jgi:O-antigen/teichoic acid export membrane protein